MTYLPEQLTATGTRQFDAQVDFMRAMTAQAFTAAEQVLALNITTSRETAVRAASTVRQLFSMTDPRDLLALGSQAQEQLSAMYAYGRELMNIANDARVNLTRHNAGIPAPAPEQPAAAREAAPAPVADQAVAMKPQQEPQDAKPAGKLAVVSSKAAKGEPRAKAKPIAKAVGKATGKRPGAPHPAAAPAPAQTGDVPLPRLDPADVAPVLELKPAKSQRKK